MKTKILFLIAALVFLSPVFSFSQDSGTPVHKQRPAQLETFGDKYVPNAFNNEKTSLPHSNSSLRNTSIFTQQVNVNGSGQNILGDAGNEPSIAFNPNNRSFVIIEYKLENESDKLKQILKYIKSLNDSQKSELVEEAVNEYYAKTNERAIVDISKYN